MLWPIHLQGVQDGKVNFRFDPMETKRTVWVLPALLCQNRPVSRTVTKGPSMSTSSMSPVIPIARFSAELPKIVPKTCRPRSVEN